MRNWLLRLGVFLKVVDPVAVVAGRGPESRSVTVTKTSASAALTAPAGTFQSGDVGRTITGTGIPASTTITAVASATAATMSANATSSGAITAVLGAGTSATYGFEGWTPESDAEAATYTVAGGGGASSPSRITSPTTERQNHRNSRS
jgi:hypothetical protein